MSKTDTLKSRNTAVSAISLLVAAYGIYVLAETLLEVLLHHHGYFNRLKTDVNLDLTLLLGVSAIYLATLLRRRKRTAWVVTILAYTFYIGIGLSQLLNQQARDRFDHHPLMAFVRVLIFPLIILLLLYIYRNEFVVKSDVRGFRTSVSFIVIILFVSIVYGVTGFMLMDKSDFHQEIDFGRALHYTIDQFNLTTAQPVQPYTRRADLFVDSLSFISLLSAVYVLLSLFQPLKLRFADQSHARDHVEVLLNRYGGEAEEFFKLWPRDKQYFFDEANESVIAFHVHRGVALCLSDPIGNPETYNSLMKGFLNLCFSNDWLPSFIHTSDKQAKLYEKYGFKVQKLGQEAIVDVDHFEAELKGSKYFRQIRNRFEKQGYTFELVSPPHHQAILDRTKAISDEWLSKGGKSERGFAMGYYTDDYMQLCEVLVARDAAGTIQAFLNVIPAEWDKEEATYDMIRQSSKAPGNVVDYLLMNLIGILKEKGYNSLNMGLSPLSGLDEETDDKKTLVDNVLKFAYANGDPFFSFSGLYKFKSKYDPHWQDKYVVYKGGLSGFSRTMTALTRYMNKSVHLPKH